jgi:K+-transporting ATPase KdpF subunit
MAKVSERAERANHEHSLVRREAANSSLVRLDRDRGKLGTDPRRAPVSTDNIIGLVLAVLLAAYLVVAILFPERI